ncbi:reverse transcriptase domain-containing protein [Tanacetum coccineum]
MAEGEIDNLTMEQYLALTRGNQAPGVVKTEIGGNVYFEIKSQFMRELRENTFSGNKNDDARDHVERVLDIVSLFNIPRVTHDAVMLHVFPITLTGAAKRWVDRLSSGTVNSWDLLEKAFIQRYNDLLYKCPTHDINSHQNGPIPGMTPAQALTAIQKMTDHSQKWHDGSSSRNIDNSSNTEGIAAIVSKLDSLGRDMKKLKKNVHAIQVGCQTYEGPHLDKECPLNEEVKSIEEVKYGEFGRSSPFKNGAKYRVGPPRYYTRVDNRPPFGEKRPNLEELLNKHLEESTRRRAEMEEWVKKLQENIEINTQNQSASLKNLETQIKQLTKEFQAKTASEVSLIANNKARVAQEEDDVLTRVLPCQLPPKELNPRSFTLPCTIGSLNFDVMADFASVNVMPKSMFEHLKLANLMKTDMLVEMTDMTKRVPIGIVENVLVKIDKSLFPLDFVVIDMLNTRNETMILRRPFLATIHAEIDVFNIEISLGIRDDRVTFDMDKKIHNFMTLVGKVYVVNSIHNDESSTSSNAPSEKSPQFEKSNDLHHENNNDNYM